MKLLTNYPVRVLATGFVVLTLLSIPLFWLGFLCRVSLSVRAPDSVRDKRIEPSGYVSRDIDTDPNLVQRSKVVAMMRPEMIATSVPSCVVSIFNSSTTSWLGAACSGLAV